MMGAGPTAMRAVACRSVPASCGWRASFRAGRMVSAVRVVMRGRLVRERKD
jgi:hypothetical protein